jgi:hypothetical protein
MQESNGYRSILAEGELTKREIASNSLREGLSIETVAKVTGLAITEVQQLHKSIGPKDKDFFYSNRAFEILAPILDKNDDLKFQEFVRSFLKKSINFPIPNKRRKDKQKKLSQILDRSFSGIEKSSLLNVFEPNISCEIQNAMIAELSTLTLYELQASEQKLKYDRKISDKSTKYFDKIFPYLLGILFILTISMISDNQLKIMISSVASIFFLLYSYETEKNSADAKIDLCINLIEKAILKKKHAETEQENYQGVGNKSPIPWWEQISGTFANNSAHDEAVRLGREYRDSLRPNSSESYDG